MKLVNYIFFKKGALAMAVKEKIKEFKEKHPELKGEAFRILYLAIGCGAGYIVGSKFMEKRISVGLERMVGAEPDIEPLMKSAAEKLKTK